MFLSLNWKMLNSIKTLLQATDSYDIRRYMAIMFTAGGSIACTVLLYLVITMLSANAVALTWIAIGLLALIAVQQTGFIGLLIKREILLTKEKLAINDKGEVLNASKQNGHTNG